jgi:hypothetical protein
MGASMGRLMTRLKGFSADSRPDGAWACTVVARSARRPSGPGTQDARRKVGIRAAVSGASTSLVRRDCLLVGYAMPKTKTRAAPPTTHRAERWQGNARPRSRMPVGCSGKAQGGDATQVHPQVVLGTGSAPHESAATAVRAAAPSPIGVTFRLDQLPGALTFWGLLGRGEGVAPATPGKPGVSPPTRNTG